MTLRVIGLLSVPVFLLYILKTGSRADLLTMIVLALLASFFSPPKWRIALLVGLPVIAGGVFVAVPYETRARLISVFSSSSSLEASNSDEIRRAADSTNARTELQKRAFQLALTHPLLGVGATNFEDAVEDMVQATLHMKSGWQVAHNTYLQIAAENGYPAFICYVWVLISVLKTNYKCFRLASGKDGVPEAVAPSFALMMMTVMFMVCTTFSNNSFDPHFNFLVGLTAANFLAIQREQAQQKVTIGAPPGARTKFLASQSKTAPLESPLRPAGVLVPRRKPRIA
jgi:O-antigen ligase